MEAFMFKANDILTQKVGEQGEAEGKDGVPSSSEVNTVGVPTQISMLSKEHEQRAQTRKDTNLSNLLAKYGGEKHLSVPEELKKQTRSTAEESLVAQPVNMMIVHSNQQNRLLQGFVGIQSKYTENAVTDGHTSIWGSAYDIKTGQWGYKCCLGFEKIPGVKCKGGSAKAEVLAKRTMV